LGWLKHPYRTEYSVFEECVITRLPNAPKNELEDFVAREYMLNKNMPQHVVDNIIWLKHINFCIRVLKQGWVVVFAHHTIVYTFGLLTQECLTLIRLKQDH
jgi:hypothetical protein